MPLKEIFNYSRDLWIINLATLGLLGQMDVFLLAFLTSPISTVALVYNRQQEVLWYGIATIVLRILALLISAVAQTFG